MISQEDNQSFIGAFPLTKMVCEIFQSNIAKNMWKETSSKRILLRSFVLKSLCNYTSNRDSTKTLLSEDESLFNNLLQYACENLITSDSMVNIEVTEEKLYRLLQMACEKSSNFTDSTKLMTIARSNELEILNQANFKTITFPIMTSFNMSKIKKYTEVVSLQDALKAYEEAPKSVRKLAVLMTKAEYDSRTENENIQSIIYKARLLITHDFDMQGFSDEYTEWQAKQNPDTQ